MRLCSLALLLGLAACADPAEPPSPGTAAQLAALNDVGSVQSPAQAPTWRYASSRNHATNSEILFAKIDSASSSDGGSYTLEIRHERPGVTEGFLTRGANYFCEGDSDETISVSFGNGNLSTIECQPCRTDHGASAFGYDQIALLNRMSDADEMVVTLNRAGGQKTKVEFQPKGFTLAPQNAPDMSEVYATF